MPVRFQKLVEQAHDAIVLVDRSFRVTYANPSAANLLNRSIEEMIGLDPRTVLHPEDLGRALKNFEQLLASSAPIEAYRIRLPNDSWLWVEISGPSTRTLDQDIGLILRDVTQRRQQDENARAREMQLVRIFEASPTPVAIVSLPEERFVDCNTRFLALIGYSAEEVLGRTPAEIGMFADPERWSQIRNFWIEPIDDKIPDQEWLLRTKDGATCETLATIDTMLVEGGGVLTILLKELAEQRRLERQILEVSALEQRRISQSLHDGLSQLLTGIALLSAVLERKLKAKQLAEAADADRIVGLVHQAVDQTRALSQGLCPVPLEADGLPDGLRLLADQIESLFGVICDWAWDELSLDLDEETVNQSYLATRDLLLLAIKSRGAKRLSLQLSRDPAGRLFRLVVIENGLANPDTDEEVQTAWRLIRYRLRILGGTINSEVGPDGCGQLITCTIPQRSPK